MKTVTVSEKTFNRLEFALLASTTLDGIGPEQIARVLIAKDGSTITIGIAPTSSDARTLAAYVAGDKDAVTKFWRNPDTGVVQVCGTKGVDRNTALPLVVQYLNRVLNDAGQDDVVCPAPKGAQIATYFAAVKGDNAFTEVSFEQVTALPEDAGFIARIGVETPKVMLLSAEQASHGAFAAGNWVEIKVPGAQAVKHIPERIDDQGRVCVAITDDQGRAGFELLNLNKIGEGQITSLASTKGNGFTYVGPTGAASDMALLTALQATDQLPAGTSIVPRNQLARLMGNVGEQIAA